MAVESSAFQWERQKPFRDKSSANLELIKSHRGRAAVSGIVLPGDLFLNRRAGDLVLLE
jgi:hypothetical protein